MPQTQVMEVSYEKADFVRQHVADRDHVRFDDHPGNCSRMESILSRSRGKTMPERAVELCSELQCQNRLDGAGLCMVPDGQGGD